MNAKVLSFLTGSLTLLMALFSFILSFNALADLAASHSVSIPPLFPLIVEAGVVIFSLNALYRSLHGESAKVQWTLIITSSLLAGTFNVLHANSDIVSRVMAAMPSLFLLLSFETFTGQVKHTVKQNAVIKSIADLMQELANKQQELDKAIADKTQELEAIANTKQQEIADRQQEIVNLDSAIAAKMQKLENINADILHAKSAKSAILQASKQAKIEERRQSVLQLLQEGYNEKAIAEQLQKDVRTIRSDILSLNGQAKVTA